MVRADGSVRRSRFNAGMPPIAKSWSLVASDRSPRLSALTRSDLPRSGLGPLSEGLDRLRSFLHFVEELESFRLLLDQLGVPA